MEIVAELITGPIEWLRKTISQAVSGLWEDGQWYPWAYFLAESKRAADLLRQAGISTDDVVSVQFPNGRQLVVLHLALARLGACVFPLHQNYGPLEAIPLLRRAGAVALVARADYHGRSREDFLVRVRDDCPQLRTVWSVEADGTLVPVADGLSPVGVQATSGSVFDGSMASLLLASSGTTSTEPKICVHSYAGLLGNAATVAEDEDYGPSDTFLAAGPMSHAFGLSSLHLALVCGGSLATVDRWHPAIFLDAARATGASVLMAVPAQLRDLVALLRETGAPAPPAVREVRTGGAAVPPSLVADVAEVLGARVVVQWGMTEVGIGCYTSGTAQSRDGGVGSPVPGARLRVVGADGTVSRIGEVGELQIDTPFGFSGYLGAPELTRAAHTDDGWIRTGDLASLDVAGAVLLHGREDERINRGGLKFSAAEVESLLADLPALRQFAVVPRPDPRLGERAVLVVSLRDGATVTLNEITAHLRGKGIALYKLPESLIVLDSVPTNAVGKVARVLVRGAVAALETAPA